jgi:hypothetical protein
MGLNLLDGVWTGTEAVFFGSLLSRGNIPATRTAVGVAFDPASGTWRRLPRSSLSPQATSAALIDGQMVAWDYELRSQEYDAEDDVWRRNSRLPLRFSECYPYSAVVGPAVFGFFCGTAALYHGSPRQWTKIGGGPLRREIRVGGGRAKLWRFAELIEAGETMFVLAEGITVPNGTPCYHCPGSPVSFWSFGRF